MVTDGNRSQANYEMVTDLVTADPQVWWNMWIPSCIDTVQGALSEFVTTDGDSHSQQSWMCWKAVDHAFQDLLSSCQWSQFLSCET